MEELISKLKSCSLLSSLSQNTLENVIIPAGKSTDYVKGTAVFRIQDTVSNVMVLLTGKVNLYYYTENGGANLQDSLMPPELPGLDLICTKTGISPYMVIAAEDSCIFSFPAKFILRPGRLPDDEWQGCLQTLLILLSHSNVRKEYRIAILSQRGLRDRIITYLTMQANRMQTLSFEIPFNRDELAAYLSVNRSALSHELSILKQEGIIDFHHNHFRLLSEKTFMIRK